MSGQTAREKFRLVLAGAEDRQCIYRMRHEVYAEELGQYCVSPDRILSDAVDEFNQYIAAYLGESLVGFISITPPRCGRYSIDKYISRSALTRLRFEDLYEIRVLTVAKSHRGSIIASVLMYAAFRWIEEQDGQNIIAMGRKKVLGIYLRLGMALLNHRIKAGAVTYELLEASVQRVNEIISAKRKALTRLRSGIEWDIDFPFFKNQKCFHGGAFFDAVGSDFSSLDNANSIINADVLDAWFPPSPLVLESINQRLPWLMRTSPPVSADGMRAAIARCRCVQFENILPGAGSSDLIYLALRQWLDKNSKVLILDPTYGEYIHVLDNLIGCRVDRLVLNRSSQYDVDLAMLAESAQMGYDLIVLVNPNNPTGRHISRDGLIATLKTIPLKTRVWVDEAYIEYAGPGESIERFAAQSPNVIVCKTMSKAYALSGVRAAYLCAASRQLEDLVAISPPWGVSLLAQVAAVRALEDEEYYARQYLKTHVLRAELVKALQDAGISDIIPGSANFVMCRLNHDFPDAKTTVRKCKQYGVFLRDVSSMGKELGSRALRIAVKDREANGRIVQTLRDIRTRTATSWVAFREA